MKMRSFKVLVSAFLMLCALHHSISAIPDDISSISTIPDISETSTPPEAPMELPKAASTALVIGPKKDIKEASISPIFRDVFILFNDGPKQYVPTGITLEDATIYRGFMDGSYPIVMTNYIYRRICHIRSMSSFVNKTEEDIKSHIKAMNPEAWKIYRTVDNRFYLFIPNVYITQIKNMARENMAIKSVEKSVDDVWDKKDHNPVSGHTIREICLGFKVDTSENLVEVTDAFKSPEKIDSIGDIEQMSSLKHLFTTWPTKSDYRDEYGIWNIVLLGHGGFKSSFSLTTKLQERFTQKIA
jgi:hypothetical protein